MRVILADDALLFREGTARVLTEAGFEVGGQAGDAAELLHLVRQNPPEVAIIDIRMPPGRSAEGVEAAVESGGRPRASDCSCSHSTSRPTTPCG